MTLDSVERWSAPAVLDVRRERIAVHVHAGEEKSDSLVPVVAPDLGESTFCTRTMSGSMVV
jgi:hypothetical protein